MIYECKTKGFFQSLEAGVHFNYSDIDFIQKHKQDYWEFFLILNNSIEHKTKTRTDILTRGSMILLRPDDIHELAFLDEKKVKHLNIMIVDDTFRALCGNISLNLYNNLYKGAEPAFLFLTEPQIATFLNTINNIHHLNVKDAAARASLLKFLVTDALHIIFEQTLFNKPESPEWLNSFIEEMRKPQNISLNVKEFVKLSNYSHNQLSLLFKKHAGVTLQDYIKELKLNYSANLLETTNDSILAISSKIGYDSLSHFDHVFKNYYKMTPIQYRKKFRK